MINLMIEQEDLKKFQFIDKVVNIPDVFGCFLLIHKKTNNFYFGFGILSLKSKQQLTLTW